MAELTDIFSAMTANETIEVAKEQKNPKKLYKEFWFENEVCCLFADANVGKSILAVQISNAIAEKLPKDVVILTAGCAKYKYNKLPLGDIGGIPRVLDAGQCNDSYSLALIALKLQEVFGLKDINDLPIAFNIAWYEQKAVIVLLALLYLGVKNIHLGPTLPAFLSPNVARVLVENFGIAGIGTVDDDRNLLVGEAG